MLDQKALEDISVMYKYLNRPNHLRCGNRLTTFTMATWHCYTNSLINTGCTFTLKNRINLKNMKFHQSRLCKLINNIISMIHF